jgi:hypothetical protein
MSLLRNCILPMTLGLFLSPVAWAGDDDKTATNKKGEELTIRGIVSEVTLVGETDIDFKTGKAVEAEEVLLTIVGHPWSQEAMEREKAREHASSDKDKDRDVKRTSNDQASPGMRHHHRMNIYVIAVSPKTKICECLSTGKTDSASVKEEKCGLDKLEVGDRVEVTFASNSTEKATTNAATQKHGRHRTYFGIANDIKILDEPMEAEHSASKSEKK